MAATAHESHERIERVRHSSDRSLGIVFAIVFLIVATWPLWFGGAWRAWALVTAAIFATLAWLAPALLGPLNRLWTALGGLLHRLMSPLVLAFIFFLVLTPLGLVMRLVGKRPLRLRFEPEATTYLITRQPPGPKPESFVDQF